MGTWPGQSNQEKGFRDYDVGKKDWLPGYKMAKDKERDACCRRGYLCTSADGAIGQDADFR